MSAVITGSEGRRGAFIATRHSGGQYRYSRVGPLKKREISP